MSFAVIAPPATRIIRKTADQTLTQSNTTLQDVTGLLTPIGANEVWYIEAVLLLNAASVNSDFKVGWTGPASATAQWATLAAAGALAGAVLAAVAVGGTPTAMNGIGGTESVGSVSGTITLGLAGWFTASSTAGNIQLQASQATSQAENNKVLANSFLRVAKLA